MNGIQPNAAEQALAKFRELLAELESLSYEADFAAEDVSLLRDRGMLSQADTDRLSQVVGQAIAELATAVAALPRCVPPKKTYDPILAGKILKSQKLRASLATRENFFDEEHYPDERSYDRQV